MKAIKFSLLAGVLLAASGVAAAQPGQGGFEGRRGPAPEMTRDQAIARADQAFARLDVNNDGRVTAEEARQAGQARMAQRQAHRGERRGQGQAQAFERLDTNRDGQISREEFAQRRALRGERGPRADGAPRRPQMGMAMRGGRRGGGERAMAMFGPDGVITRDEFRARAVQRFERMDANRDGRITAEERQQVRQRIRQERQERRVAPAQN